MNVLVGYSGFVGSNIYAKGNFDKVYNSKNIQYAYGTKPDLLIYAGLRAEKYLANKSAEKDRELIIQAEKNIEKIMPQKVVLISTIDVFKSPVGVDENSTVETDGLHAYGYNRYLLEQWVRENYLDALIIRLPGLFGKNIKKNFIYDCMNLIPTMITVEKMQEISAIESDIIKYYSLQENGFYKVQNVQGKEREQLKQKFINIGFTSLNFTDSRSEYQFYNLERLWEDIQIALSAGIKLWHPATAPVSAKELFYYMTQKNFNNELSGFPAKYDYRTIYNNIFGGENGYIMNKSEVLAAIKTFVNGG